MASIDSVLPIILGAGGAGFIAAVIQGYQALRNGVEQREARAIGNLEKWGNDAVARADRCNEDLEKERLVNARLRARNGRLEYELTSHGLPVPPEDVLDAS